MPTLGTREIAALLYLVGWLAVTVILTLRGAAIVEGSGWWVGGPGGVAVLWKVFTPPPPSSGREG